MKSNKQDFWDTQKDWSRRKHLILTYYLPSAVAKLRAVSPTREVVVLDAFAGRGTYKDGNPASPVLIGQMIDRMEEEWKDPVRLQVFNIEPDQETFEELEASTEKWSKTGQVYNLKGKFQEKQTQLLKQIEGLPMVAFLDPFAPSHLLFKDIEPLIRRNAPTDILIVFHSQNVMRVFEASHSDSRTQENTKESNRKRLSEILGGDQWQDLPPDSKDTVQSLLNIYLQNIRATMSSRNRYAYATEIYTRHEVGLKYHVIFVTRHEEGLKSMNDAFCKQREDIYKQTGGVGGLFADETTLPNEMNTEDRADFLLSQMSAARNQVPSKEWRRKELMMESIKKSFGQFLEKEHRQAVATLVQRKILIHVNANESKRLNDDSLLKFAL